MTKTCGTCRFSAPALTADRKIDFTQRLCKFNPPSPLLVPGPGGQPILNFFWPMLATNQCCGRWQESQGEPLLAGEAVPAAVEAKAN